MMSTAVSVATRASVRPLAVALGLLVLTGYLGFLAVGRLVDSSGQLALPGLRDLYLFLGLPVAGLLGLRVLGGGRLDEAAVARGGARWSAVWAGVTGICLLFTTARAAGVGVWELASSWDNLIPVMANDNTVLAQSAVLWVALLVAFFGPSLTTRRENAALLVLTLVAVLGAVPTAFTGARHGGHPFHPFVVASAVAQLLAIASWLGAAIALVSHRWLLAGAPAVLLRRYAVGASVAAAVMAVAGLVSRTASLSGWNEVWTSLPGRVILAEAVLVGLVLYVGSRHRRRMVESLADSAPHGSAPGPSMFRQTEGGLPNRNMLYLLVGSDVVLGLVVLTLSVTGTTGSG
jgi:putative copper export protein